MASVFLTAEWKKLAMANYPADPAALRPFVPPRTELDFWQGETYVSLVGFQFRKVQVKGWRIPDGTYTRSLNIKSIAISLPFTALNSQTSATVNPNPSSWLRARRWKFFQKGLFNLHAF